MLTAKEALEFFNKKFTVLPKGVTATVVSNVGVVVGTKDKNFVLSGETLAHDEEFMFVRAKQSLKALEEELRKEVKPSGSHKPPK